MKSRYLTPLLLVALLLAALPARAHDFEVGGIYYNIIDSDAKTVEVTHGGQTYKTYSNEYRGTVSIPETVTYSSTIYSVTAIHNDTFRGCELTYIKIPNSVTYIGEKAFYSCDELTSVNITDIEAWCKISFIGDDSNPLSYAGNLYLNGELVTNLVIPNTITEIKDYAFRGCSNLTSVELHDAVTSIGKEAFFGTGLTSVTIPSSVYKLGSSAFSHPLTTVNYNARYCYITDGSPFSGSQLTSVTIGENVQYIPDDLFYYKYNLTSIEIPNSVWYIGERAFQHCTKLKSIVIPNSVKTIGDRAFYGCEYLTSVEIQNTEASIGTEVFMGCYDLISTSKKETQTTATLKLSTPTIYAPGAIINGIKYNDNTITLSGLKPGRDLDCDLYLIINDNWCIISGYRLGTKSFNVSISGSTGSTTINAIGSHNADDVIIAQQGIDIGSTTEYNGNNSIEATRLEPNTSYDIYYKVYLEGGWPYSANKTFTTAALTWESGEYQATSTSSVRLLTETNCDATEGTGIEWRRYGAPENMKPNSVACPVVDGMLVGTLRGLNPDVYYEYRPYYTSAAGNTYYGEWTAFFSGDAYVHFDPEVRTYADMQVYKNNATIKGYALEGSDAISAQGFEYWKSSNQPVPASTAEVKTIAASGIAMTATLSDLEFNTTYCYRAFVTTATGTYYGDTMEFTTEVISGIETIDVDATELTVSLRENPATATAWVRAAGAAATDCQYYIVSMNGSTVDNDIIPADGDWQPIELNCPSGVYILMVTDGSARRTLRLIVR